MTKLRFVQICQTKYAQNPNSLFMFVYKQTMFRQVRELDLARYVGSWTACVLVIIPGSILYLPTGSMQKKTWYPYISSTPVYFVDFKTSEHQWTACPVTSPSYRDYIVHVSLIFSQINRWVCPTIEFFTEIVNCSPNGTNDDNPSGLEVLHFQTNPDQHQRLVVYSLF